MKGKDEDLKDWMWQHCNQCARKNSQCVTPNGDVVGGIGCYTGTGDDRIFCPYNPGSLMRYKMMKTFQARSRAHFKAGNTGGKLNNGQ